MTDQSHIEPVIGPYQLDTLIGASGMGRVYRATHRESGQPVALRVIPPPLKPEVVVALREEMRMLQDIDHPSLVPVLDYGVHQRETFYVAMPFLTGGTLRERLIRRTETGPLPSLGEMAQIVGQIGGALDAIHSSGVVHCQVEPRNIMFDEAGNAYLADTGIARLFKITFSLRATGALATHVYSSPEQWSGQKLFPPTDQYSLAVTAYELITGRPPFQAVTIFQLMQMHLNDMIQPPHTLREEAPPALTIPLALAMGKDPDGRYPNLAEFHKALVEAITGAEGDPTGFTTFPLAT